MKAFVIKNKEGKYWQEDTRLFTELYLATFYKEKHLATKDAIYLCPEFDWKNYCEVIEITIAEGDLNQQLAEKDKENKLLRDVLDNLKGDKSSQKLVNAVNAVYEPLLEQRDVLIRKQVCDELRDYFEKFTPIFIQVKTDVLDKLDQIEQGE